MSCQPASTHGGDRGGVQELSALGNGRIAYKSTLNPRGRGVCRAAWQRPRLQRPAPTAAPHHTPPVPAGSILPPFLAGGLCIRQALHSSLASQAPPRYSPAGRAASCLGDKQLLRFHPSPNALPFSPDRLELLQVLPVQRHRLRPREHRLGALPGHPGMLCALHRRGHKHDHVYVLGIRHLRASQPRKATCYPYPRSSA